MPDLLNTIDISHYLSGKATPKEARELAQKLVQESERVGFFYVKGWEQIVPKHLVDQVFEYVSTHARSHNTMKPDRTLSASIE